MGKKPGMRERFLVLDVYIPERQALEITVVILPCGAYCGRAAHEGADVTQKVQLVRK